MPWLWTRINLPGRLRARVQSQGMAGVFGRHRVRSDASRLDGAPSSQRTRPTSDLCLRIRESGRHLLLGSMTWRESQETLAMPWLWTRINLPGRPRARVQSLDMAEVFGRHRVRSGSSRLGGALSSQRIRPTSDLSLRLRESGRHVLLGSMTWLRSLVDTALDRVRHASTERLHLDRSSPPVRSPDPDPPGAGRPRLAPSQRDDLLDG
jgi:hypothetical protein